MEIRSSGKMSNKQEDTLLEKFSERFDKAKDTVKAKRVKKRVFSPSGRVIWVVKGRKGNYQVIPNLNFCSCNDFYFRVMSGKKQVCYHLIAQKLADVLDIFVLEEASDREYKAIRKR